MISLEQKKLLSDILEAITSIDDHLEGKRIFEQYLHNKKKYSTF